MGGLILLGCILSKQSITTGPDDADSTPRIFSCCVEFKQFCNWQNDYYTSRSDQA